MKRILRMSLLCSLLVGLAACKSTAEEAPMTEAETAATLTVEAGCASCIYGMDGVEGCQPAVRIDGKTYLVTASDFDAHGAGLCSATRTAEVSGSIEGDRFVAESFEIEK